MQKKTRKNWILRFAGIAMMFTLISTCLLSFTLAKYVTTATDFERARVAKWGVNVEFTSDSGGDGLFQSQYIAGNSGYNGALSVQCSGVGTDLLIAPGEGRSSTFTITGTPEVAVSVDIDTHGSAMIGMIGSNDYEPVLWSIEKGSEPILMDGSFDDFLSVLNGLSGQYAPNTDLEHEFGSYTISWNWPFNSGGIADGIDTELGNLAATVADEDMPGFVLDLIISVTQID